jgi:hypothetical protein
MAVRITLKRSSIFNKRPSSSLLDPGELALNTNALTPGLFFEAENNSVIKVGPTYVGDSPPTLTPSLGETYYNITNSGFNTLTLPSGMVSGDAGAFWVLRNNTQSYLVFNPTYNSGTGPTTITIAPSTAVTFAWDVSAFVLF